MGVDLSGKGDRRFYANLAGWRMLLTTAYDGGWRPSGTLAPDYVDEDEWSGTYIGCSGQWVTADDAQRMATGVRHPKNAPLHPVEEEFAHFCSGGGFRIW